MTMLAESPELRRVREEGLLVAYFSSEFGLDERLPIYAGGLGVLAGDHLKCQWRRRERAG